MLEKQRQAEKIMVCMCKNPVQNFIPSALRRLACNSPEAGLFLNLWCRDWGYLKLVVTVGDMMLNEKEKIMLNTNF